MRWFMTTVVLCGIAILGPLQANAQSGGGLGGLNIANLVAGPRNYSEAAGGAGGFNLSPRINDFVRLQIEGYYSQKGAEGDTTAAMDTVSGRTRLNYFEMPMQIRLLTPGETGRLFINFGGAIAFRLRCSVDLYTATYQLVPTDDCKGATGADLIKGTDWSAVAGIGFDFHVNGGDFSAPGFFQTVELRLTNGFTSVGTSRSPDSIRPVKNRVISFLVRGNGGK